VNLERLKQVLAADVWKGGRLAGTLERRDGGVVFEYAPDYDGPDVATTLPGGSVIAAPAGAVPPFFAGLLPEGRRLTALRAATKTSADDELTLLLAVGGDTIGDVRVLPAGSSPSAAPALLTESEGLQDVVFADLFEDVLANRAPHRPSFAGVQDKVSGDMIALPVALRGASWILKLNPPGKHRQLVENEAFFLAAARLSRIDAAHGELIRDATGEPGLLVRRFDRLQSPHGDVLRVPQEDACQVLGRYPADKYRVTAEDIVQNLARQCGAPVVAARTLIQQLAFAYLTGNGDAHAKNFSIQHVRGEWRVTPAYDLPSTLPYDDTTMAVTIQGKDREDIGRGDLVDLGQLCGVTSKAIERVLDELLQGLNGWLDDLHRIPFDSRVLHKLAKAIRYRADRLRGG
jgi:serine/threonine-protein kinase HipA